MKKLGFILFSLYLSLGVAGLKTEVISYSSGQEEMEGVLAFDDTDTKPKPGLLIVHDWMGLGNFTRDKAVELAKQGYVAFAVDVYGKGIRPKDATEAGKFAGKYKNDRNLFRAHMKAAYDLLRSRKEVVAEKIAVFGYCFGGTAALELARSGVPLRGTGSFHGGLANPNPADAKNIQGRVLILHGADDPFVSPNEVNTFKQEMTQAKVKFDFISYPGAVHAFAVPAAGNNVKSGAAYDSKADKESWLTFQKFLKEIFSK